LIRVYPNPVINGSTVVETNNLVQMLVIKDVTGRNVYSSLPNAKRIVVDCTWPSGIYILHLQINGRWASKKLQVIKR
jgi:hypothetical protein